MTLSEEIFQDYLEYYDTVDTIVVGGNSYTSLAQHWQNAEYSKNDLERAIAKRMNEIPKVAISNSDLEPIWRNSRQILVKNDDSFLREVENLKHHARKISVESGIKTWQRFIKGERENPAL